MKFYDDYKLQSGWIHDYYCDSDGSELIFDLENSDYFECPLCHKKYVDLKRKRAWITKYRYDVFNKIEKYSELYLIEKNDEYLNYIIDALEYYTKNYDKFKIHNKNGEVFKSYINESNECGRITAQGLNEAAITIQIVNCISNIKDYLPNKLKTDIFNKLFPSVFKLLKPQINKIHNIKCYQICSIGMMGIISNNDEMINFALNSEYSFYKQLELGTTKEHFWFEGSFHYHLYILKPILQFLLIAKKYNYNYPKHVHEIVKDMLRQAFLCSFSDCTLPSPNDGWPNKSLKDYLIDYKIANFIYNDELENIIDMINKNVNNDSTIHLIDTGFSILKNKYYNVFIKYKDNNINHSHPDKLNIEVKIKDKFLTHDLSTSGYGSEINSLYYKKTYSHNTVIVNGENQNLNCSSNVLKYDNNIINVRVTNAYPNVAMTRKINIDDKKFYDEFLVESSKKEKFDYFFHCDAKLITSMMHTHIDKMEEYPYLTDIIKIKTNDNEMVLDWKLDDIEITSIINMNNKEIYICKSPDNPNENSRTTILLRNKKKSNKEIFSMEWNVK